MSLSDEYDVRKILGVVIIVLVLISVVMYVVMQAPEEKPPVIVEPTNITEPPTIYEERKGEITAECMADEDYLDKEECLRSGLMTTALSSLDERYCDLIDVEFYKSYCISQTLKAKAEANDDPSICDELGDGAQDCIDRYYSHKAAVENDPSYCDMMSEGGAAEECHDAFYNEEAYATGNCSMLESERKRGLCIIELAEEQGDVSLCSEINDPRTFRQCLERLYGAPLATNTTEDGSIIFTSENGT